MARVQGRLRPEGALAEITIGPSQFAIESGAAGAARSVKAMALFDTGADITVIHSGLAALIGLVPHDRIEVAGMHDSTATCDVYDVNLTLHTGGIELPNLTVVEGFVVGAPLVQVLIGRSVLWKGVLVYDGLRQEFSFEVPTTG